MKLLVCLLERYRIRFIWSIFRFTNGTRVTSLIKIFHCNLVWTWQKYILSQRELLQPLQHMLKWFSKADRYWCITLMKDGVSRIAQVKFHYVLFILRVDILINLASSVRGVVCVVVLQNPVACVRGSVVSSIE